jgi:AraC family transcriptional regulator of adaptative response/methylated-DNA-[protein]-cysteine methyltransferase
MTGSSETEARFSTDQQRWEALVRRDREADGAFVYGVVTTGIYCRPWCRSRIPKRGNVRFFSAADDAEREGFRACLRCMPGDPDRREAHHAAVVSACAALESDEPPALGELAEAAGLSPSHFQRLFRRMVGVTPKQYFLERRAERVRAGIRGDSSVTDAVYEAGFGSGSRFYAEAGGILGMKPSQFRRGGEGMLIRTATAESYLGAVLVAVTEKGICCIELGDDPVLLHQELRARFPRAEIRENDPGLGETVGRVAAFLKKPSDGFGLPLDIQGTAFQRRVWQALRLIPPGTTVTYTELAHRLGSPRAVRAVASACAANPVAVAVPCHRVVRRDGGLAGYRWGIERKRALLDREKE